MKVAYLTHSLMSCWNHGNAHFLRGVLRELQARGHEVVAFEPAQAWSRENLHRDHGESGFDAFRSAYPELRCQEYSAESDLAELVENADLVIVHEWTEPSVVAAVGRLRRSGGRFTLLFHDTHHRAVSEPEAIRAFDLDGYDGVLAFGEALAEVYRRWGWAKRAFVWHEAADTSLFRPPVLERSREGLVWIGNWGDDERSDEIVRFLLRPAHDLDIPLDIHGVRYPKHARAALDAYGARYRGWLPNARAPEVFARYLATVHVPRRFYVERLPGIPTIRVFEALACGIPLICSPWKDAEGLFRPGMDFLVARNEAEMRQHLLAVRDDRQLRQSLVESGLESIRTRHSCVHRVNELFSILARLGRLTETAEVGV